MIDLTVLIPTYNREDRLKKSLASYTQEKIKNIEFVVIDNCSKDNTEALVRSLIAKDDRIKYFKNPTNLGYNRNLFRGYLEAEADWLCILPDDDAVEFGFLSELIEKIDQNNDCSIILTAQKILNHPDQKILNQTKRLRKGVEAFKIAYKASGSVTGYTFNKKLINLNEWHLDNSIYPQIRISVEASLRHDILYFIPNKMPVLGNYDTLEDAINNSMGRPLDFGVLERLSILIEESKKINNDERIEVINQLASGLFYWSILKGKEMYVFNKDHAINFFKCLLKHPFIKSSSTFLGLLGYILIFNKEVAFRDQIKIMAMILKSIFMSIFKYNFYSSLLFSFQNFRKVNL